jgi:hypothetical protein
MVTLQGAPYLRVFALSTHYRLKITNFVFMVQVSSNPQSKPNKLQQHSLNYEN